MRIMKIVKIVLLGNLVMNTPFILSFIYINNYSHSNYMVSLAAMFVIGYLYWSMMAPWYRKYSIVKLKSKNEFFLWKKLSVYSLLLWPDNFILNKTELWDDENYDTYQKKLTSLDEN
ncbi:hypothetical protein [Nonlabens antarcticus]|uniref:hypothetical protein n=1 Tax=Nonlabens antarcticus TaxID=392714 RepID=UPI0018919995|nr:hypothetical protein [Nonlabens antarcticus]